MSRIGRMPVPIPSGATVALAGRQVEVKGPKGCLTVDLPDGIQLELAEGEARLSRRDESKPQKSLHGLARALVANAVTGVTQGFMKKLEIQGVGYRAEVKGKELRLALGYSHPVVYAIPEGIEIKVERNTQLEVSGFDRQQVGQVAAEIRSLRKPDPYKGKGIRYAGEHIRIKAGKSGVK
jgi:large subunit ribosomal protein L6